MENEACETAHLTLDVNSVILTCKPATFQAMLHAGSYWIYYIKCGIIKLKIKLQTIYSSN